MKARRGKAKFRQFPWSIEIDGIERAWLVGVRGGDERIRRFASKDTDIVEFDALEVRGVTDDPDFWTWLEATSRASVAGGVTPAPDLLMTLAVVAHSEEGEELKRVELVDAFCSYLIGAWDVDTEEGRFGEAKLCPSLIRDVDAW